MNQFPFDPSAILNALVYVALLFSTLPGVASLSVALTNVVKVIASWFGRSIDGYSDRVAAGLSLFMFGALVYFQVFRPDLTLVFIDGRAASIAQALVILTGFLGQLLLQKPIYKATAAKLPVVTASYSEAAAGTTVAMVATNNKANQEAEYVKLARMKGEWTGEKNQNDFEADMAKNRREHPEWFADENPYKPEQPGQR